MTPYRGRELSTAVFAVVPESQLNFALDQAGKNAGFGGTFW
jgi:hypothetical protein